jgi:hypothetical protein
MAKKKKLDALAVEIESLSCDEAEQLAMRFNREAAALIRESPGRAVSLLADALATVRTLIKVMRREDIAAARKLAKILASD